MFYLLNNFHKLEGPVTTENVLLLFLFLCLMTGGINSAIGYVFKKGNRCNSRLSWSKYSLLVSIKILKYFIPISLSLIILSSVLAISLNWNLFFILLRTLDIILLGFLVTYEGPIIVAIFYLPGKWFQTMFNTIEKKTDKLEKIVANWEKIVTNWE